MFYIRRGRLRGLAPVTNPSAHRPVLREDYLRLAARFAVGVRTSSTGTAEDFTTVSASLPRRAWLMPRRPCVPMTMMSARHFCASLRMKSATRPVRFSYITASVSYTHLRAHETDSYLVC